MPIGYAELQRFYEALVARAREAGVTCAITSGMACVAYGLAETTKDCDLLCAPETAEPLLQIIAGTKFQTESPHYRGNLSPPLDERWLRGGWTSHFVWKTPEGPAHLDLFGLAPRGTDPWVPEIQGFYAGPHTVAEMKRTNRDKDWPFITGLGTKMLKARDARGWLHIYDAEVLRAFRNQAEIPASMIGSRPILKLVQQRDSGLAPTLHVERLFWHELDRARLGVYEHAVRPYMVAVRKALASQKLEINAEHRIRVECAQRHLPLHPLQDYGIERMIAEAREALAPVVSPPAMQWLPDVRKHFIFAP